MRERRWTICSVLPSPTKSSVRFSCGMHGTNMFVLDIYYENLVGNLLISRVTGAVEGGFEGERKETADSDLLDEEEG